MRVETVKHNPDEILWCEVWAWLGLEHSGRKVMDTALGEPLQTGWLEWPKRILYFDH